MKYADLEKAETPTDVLKEILSRADMDEKYSILNKFPGILRALMTLI